MCWFCKLIESRHRRETIVMKGTFTVVFNVEAPPPLPLSVASPEDLGVAGAALPAGSKLEITGGTPPYSVTNATGSAPPGVTLNADGTLTGTPTTPGQYSVSIDVADSLG